MPVNNTDFLFPPRVIPELRNLRGDDWEIIVDSIVDVPSDNIKRLAFVLMMVRLAGCITCQADSYKAMRGCSICAIQTVKRFKGNDNELFRNIEIAKHDIMTHFDSHQSNYD